MPIQSIATSSVMISMLFYGDSLEALASDAVKMLVVGGRASELVVKASSHKRGRVRVPRTNK